MHELLSFCCPAAQSTYSGFNLLLQLQDIVERGNAVLRGFYYADQEKLGTP
jgi:hypothetical protein